MPSNLASESDLSAASSTRGRRETGSSLRRPGRLAEGALDKALQCVARVSGELGHELNNQLAVILNYTYVLGRRVGEGAGLQEHLDEMRRAAWTASDLANQMHHFGQARRPPRECTALGELLTELEPVLQHGLDPDRELEVRIDGDLFPVLVARGPLESMLLRAALFKHRSVAPANALCIHAYNARRDTTAADGSPRQYPAVQLEIGPLPASTGHRASAGGKQGSTAEQLLSERMRAGLGELGAELEVDETDDQVTVTLWLPASE